MEILKNTVAVLPDDRHDGEVVARLGRRWRICPPGDAPDVVLAFGSPAVDESLETVDEAELRWPGAPVVLAVPPMGVSSLRRLLREPVLGVVEDVETAGHLAAALRAAVAGQCYLPRRVYYGRTRPALSRRERQVLGMVVLGMSNAEIASALVLTESTVKSHISSSYRKLGVRSRKDATALLLDRDRGAGLGVLTLSAGEPDDAPGDVHARMRRFE